MSSSRFAPLIPDAEGPEARFRPLAGDPARPPPQVARAEPGEEVRRAFRAGYAEGHAEAMSRVESIGESLTSALAELAAFRCRMRDRHERELLELALGVVRRVVRRELAERPEIWLGMIRHAVHRVVSRERIAVRLPPPLMAFLHERLPALRASLEEVQELELVEDPALPEGGCVVESRFGDVDVGVDTQLEAAERALVHAESERR